MTETTVLGRRQMRWCRIIDLASGKCTVMTGITALTVDLGRRVIKGRRDKARGLVANAAITGRRYVITVLADDGITIVTRYAVVGDARMIIPGTRKGGGVMAVRTIPIHTIDDGRRMIAWLDGHRRHGAVVTACAIIRDTCVIEH